MHRRVAAQLHRHALDRLRAGLQQLAADLGRAGEAQRAHRGALLQRVDDRLRRAGDDRENARRDAGAIGELRQRQGRVRRLACRPDHHRAAGGERCRGLAGDHRRRKVPGRDCGRDADRLAPDAHLPAGQMRHDALDVDPLRLLGEPLDEARGIGDLALGLGERLALLERHDQGEVVLGLDHELEPAPKVRCALLGQEPAPRGKGCGGGRDRGLGLGTTQRRHDAKPRARRGVGDRHDLAVLCRRPLAADVGVLAEQPRVLQLRKLVASRQLSQHRVLRSGSLGEKGLGRSEVQRQVARDRLEGHAATADVQAVPKMRIVGERLCDGPEDGPGTAEDAAKVAAFADRPV